MALFFLVFSVIGLVLVGVGFAIGLVACVMGAILLGLGVISTSTLIGIRTGRVSSGIRALLLQCGLLGGIPAGAVCAGLGQSFFEAYGSGWPIFIYGALGGATAGLLIALSLDFILHRMHTWAAARMPVRRVTTPGALDL